MKRATIDRIRDFSKARDWDPFHTPANLAKSISIMRSDRGRGGMIYTELGTVEAGPEGEAP